MKPLDKRLGSLVKVMGFASFIFWIAVFLFSIGMFLFILSQIPSIPERSPENVDFGGAVYTFFLILIIVLTGIALFGSISGIVTYFGGRGYTRKRNIGALVASLSLNISIITTLVFVIVLFLVINLEFGLYTLVVASPFLTWYFIVVSLTIAVLYMNINLDNKKNHIKFSNPIDHRTQNRVNLGGHFL